MTTTVLATTTTRTKRREPLETMAMEARSATVAGGAGKGKERRTTRLSASKHELDKSTSKPGKRSAVEYEEDAEDFQFSLLPSKKSRPSVEPIPEGPKLDTENAPPKSTPKRGRPRKKQAGDEITSSAIPANGKSVELPSRRPKRGTAKTAQTEPEPQPTNNMRSSRTRDSPEHQPEAKKPKKAGRPPKNKAQTPVPESNEYRSPVQPAGTKVALPVADTPVIQRNKELRGGKGDKGERGRRRSSLGMRGRRASSLIDSGTSNALPHREVGTADFYKHIADDGLPEPRRMRQLLIWCATRAIGDKPTGGSNSDDQSARLAARVIQEEILREFSTTSNLSNWFDREDLNPPAVVVRKPNPRNVQNSEKIKELEEHIQRLQKERQSLNALLRQPPIPKLEPFTQSHNNLQPQNQSSSKPHLEEIDPSLLDPSQQAILASLKPPSRSDGDVPAPPSSRGTANATSTRTPFGLPTRSPDAPAQAAQHGDSKPSDSEPSPRVRPETSAWSAELSRLTSGLAPTVDVLAAGVHDIELYRAAADKVSSHILRICARRLEERDAHHWQHHLTSDGKADQRPVEADKDLGLVLGALGRLERR
ncbi:uncharacterized protein N7515_004330 [Penicillium bovifimosum]|uniref:Uncharacterized protein n=1 Tax=Penicillium bovifimosum TaxID=126998 RepID=A0A9W9GZX0_9EURO|nr:uncharacterized protein N7515_004330 [Penicillium bovifimosum]KAJ5135052.1 hypothetical protein N7515_004330 [Penicillium bovifimosum]